MKVLFIAGSGRSGSTLLANLLGQVPGFFTGGELRYVWQRGLVANRLCGCGQPFQSCPEWRPILDRSRSGRDWAAVAERLEPPLRIRALAGLRTRRSTGGPWPADVAEAVRELYTSIGCQTGCRVLVDSSKLPSYGRLLEDCLAGDLYVVHLVRDPRAVAFSWLQTRELADAAAERTMHRQPPLKSALDWVVWNGAAEVFWSRHHDRYLRLRYEDLMADPARALREVATLVGETVATDNVVSGGFVDMRPTHSVAGNPARMQSGRLQLRPDLVWTDELATRHRWLVTTLALPLLRHYGYKLRTGRGRP